MPIELEDIQLFTVGEVCKRLRIRKTKAYILMNRGDLQTVMLGGQRLVSAHELKRFIAGLPTSKPAETERSALMRDVQEKRQTQRRH